MKKEIQVHMLSTKDSSNLRLNPDGKPKWYTMKSGVGNYNIIKPQHLYITTDEEIKEGDWITDGHKIYRNKVQLDGYIGIYKIIATTDKSLKVNCRYCEETGYDNRSRCQSCNGLGLEQLSQIPQSFIEEFCAKGGIWKVLVEYEYLEKVGNILIAKHNSNNINSLECEYISKLKLTPNNEIIIHPIKDSWTREEVEILCRDAYLQGQYYSLPAQSIMAEQVGIEDWIKENL